MPPLIIGDVHATASTEGPVIGGEGRTANPSASAVLLTLCPRFKGGGD